MPAGSLTQARGVVQETQTQIAIVGGGPVGLVLALLLDFHGAKCTIFNAEPESRWHPKGNGQNARTMELYRRLGFSDEVRRLGLPGDHPFDQAYFTRLSSYEIYRFPMPSRDERIAMRRQMPVTDQLPEPMFHVNQMYVERYLLERVRRSPNIDVRFGWQVDWFTQNEDGVRLHARKTGTSDEIVCNADYAAACDGGNGFVRKTLGIAYEGDIQKKDAYWAGQFFSIYMRIPELYAKFVGRRRAWMYWAINPDPHTRGVIFSLNGADEFMMLIKPERGHSGSTPSRWPIGSSARSAPTSRSRFWPTIRGTRGRPWSPNAIAPAASSSPATPRICSHRPAASG